MLRRLVYVNPALRGCMRFSFYFGTRGENLSIVHTWKHYFNNGINTLDRELCSKRHLLDSSGTSLLLNDITTPWKAV